MLINSKRVWLISLAQATLLVVSNGTAALHIALIVAGVKRDDEVLVPAMSFVATANAVSHAGAIPNFVDVTEDTLESAPKSSDIILNAVLSERRRG